MTDDTSNDTASPPRAQALAVRAPTKAAATAKKPAARKTAAKPVEAKGTKTAAAKKAPVAKAAASKSGAAKPASKTKAAAKPAAKAAGAKAAATTKRGARAATPVKEGGKAAAPKRAKSAAKPAAAKAASEGKTRAGTSKATVSKAQKSADAKTMRTAKVARRAQRRRQGAGLHQLGHWPWPRRPEEGAAAAHAGDDGSNHRYPSVASPGRASARPVLSQRNALTWAGHLCRQRDAHSCGEVRGADLHEDVERVQLVPVLDEAAVLDAPDIDAAHRERLATWRTAQELTEMGALVGVSANRVTPVGGGEHGLGRDVQVGHGAQEMGEEPLRARKSLLHVRIVVDVMRCDQLAEAADRTGVDQLGVEMAEPLGFNKGHSLPP